VPFLSSDHVQFALCFGLSFFLIMDGAARRGVDFRGRFAWRLILLLVIGTLHGLIYRGDILQILALLGLTMLLFDRIKDNRLLTLLGILCFLQIPLLVRAWAAAQGFDWAAQTPLFMHDDTMPALTDGSLGDVLRVNLVDGQLAKWSYYAATGRLTQMLGLFMLGLVLGRTGFFTAPERYRTARRVTLAIAAGVAAQLWFEGPEFLDLLTPNGSAARPYLGWAIDCWTNLAILTVEVCLFIEIYETAARPLLRSLAAPGRMTLTLYVGQSLVFIPIFYGFGLGLHDDLTLAQSLWIGLVAFAAQIAFAHWWFGRFHYGPLEWLWRAATRTTLNSPFRRQAGATA